MPNKPKTSPQVTDWTRTLSDDGWESEGSFEGFYVLDDMDEDDFLDECDADGVSEETAEAVAALVDWDN